jgi:hypothetical protein
LVTLPSINGEQHTALVEDSQGHAFRSAPHLATDETHPMADSFGRVRPHGHRREVVQGARWTQEPLLPAVEVLELHAVGLDVERADAGASERREVGIST